MRRLTSSAGEFVVKSPHPNPVLAWFGRRAIRREARAYARLDGIAGIPRSHGLAAGEHLVLAHIEGATLRQAAGSLADREAFFARLLATIEAMHEAGIAHGDLKRKENTLVAANEQPCIIDFGIAVRRRDGSRGWNKQRFELVRQMDLNAWIKLKHGPHTDDLPPAEAALYRPLMIERWARRLRPSWKRLTFRRWRKQRRARRQSGD